MAASADIISLEYGLRAMKEAELPANDPAWQKAIKFLQRTQNNNETNDQACTADDGGFIYYPGYSQIEGTTQSYGSATYAGIMSYSWANLKKNDRRVQSALKWIRAATTRSTRIPGIGQKTRLLLLHGVRQGAAGDGRARHRRRQGRQAQLARGPRRQAAVAAEPDGYWVNDKNPAEMQDNKMLVTAFTMMAIEAILQ